MNELLVGYARVSTEQQDLTAQRNGLHALGVGDDRIYVDHGLTGTNRDRPGLRLALAACRAGDTLVVTKLDRLARSLPDARDILDELTRRNVKLSLGGSIHDPTDPVGRLLFNVLAMVAEFESDLIRLCTRERPFAHIMLPRSPNTEIGAPRNSQPSAQCSQSMRALMPNPSKKPQP
jgi:DNA invertase Pin-like site-specific DNA recombinase